ncbi:hypothetical protein C8F01DRAFT_792314 [Mycena amicta]|nr:hypothetical protein C8F01DRAFT_792314 [Mycena amicta]
MQHLQPSAAPSQLFVPPELVTAIAQSCSQPTLAAMCRVSRSMQPIAEHQLYHCVELLYPCTMAQVLAWCETVTRNPRLSFRHYSLVLEIAAMDVLPTRIAAIALALWRCVNLKRLRIADHTGGQLPLKQILNGQCPFRLTHFHMNDWIGIPRDFWVMQTAIQSLTIPSEYLRAKPVNSLAKLPLVAIKSNVSELLTMVAHQSSWKLHRALIELKPPYHGIHALWGYARTLRVLTLQRAEGITATLSEIVALVAKNLPRLTDLHILEMFHLPGPRDEGPLLEACKPLTCLQSFVLHLRTAGPDGAVLFTLNAEPIGMTMAGMKIVTSRMLDWCATCLRVEMFLEHWPSNKAKPSEYNRQCCIITRDATTGTVATTRTGDGWDIGFDADWEFYNS